MKRHRVRAAGITDFRLVRPLGRLDETLDENTRCDGLDEREGFVKEVEHAVSRRHDETVIPILTNIYSMLSRGCPVANTPLCVSCFCEYLILPSHRIGNLQERNRLHALRVERPQPHRVDVLNERMAPVGE